MKKLEANHKISKSQIEERVENLKTEDFYAESASESYEKIKII